jgi:hypothetical protein
MSALNFSKFTATRRADARAPLLVVSTFTSHSLQLLLVLLHSNSEKIKVEFSTDYFAVMEE